MNDICHLFINFLKSSYPVTFIFKFLLKSRSKIKRKTIILKSIRQNNFNENFLHVFEKGIEF